MPKVTPTGRGGKPAPKGRGYMTNAGPASYSRPLVDKPKAGAAGKGGTRKGIGIANPFDPFDPNHQKNHRSNQSSSSGTKPKQVTYPNQGVRKNIQRMATTGTGRYAMPKKKKK